MTLRSLYCILQDHYPEVDFELSRMPLGVRISATSDSIDESMPWFIDNTIVPLGIDYELVLSHLPIQDPENTWIYYYGEWHPVQDLNMEHYLMESEDGVAPKGFWISESYGISVADTDFAITKSEDAPIRPPLQDGVEYMFPRDGLGLSNG